MDKDTQNLIKRIERLGGRVNSQGGHVKVYKDDVLVYSMASTPSDPRSMKNAIAGLQKAGFPLRNAGRKKGHLSDRAARALGERISAFLDDKNMSATELARLSEGVGKAKGLRCFKSEGSGYQVIHRLVQGTASTAKWAGDLLSATLNELERPPDSLFPPVEPPDAYDEFGPPLPKASLWAEWEPVFDSMERTLKLLRGAVRRTLEEQ